MLKNEKIAFIGSGVMAQAMIAGLVNQNLIDPQQIIASDLRPERGKELHARYGVRHTTNNAEAVQEANIIVLSVKPQVMDEALADIKGNFSSKALILSIAAGVTLSRIKNGLAYDNIVRVMPNTPARVGK